VFLRSKQVVTGLDIGTTSVKVVRLAHSGSSTKLQGVAMAEIREPDGSEDGQESGRERIVDAIRQALAAAGASGSKRSPVVTAIGGPQVSIKHVPFPRMSEQDLADSVRWEAKKHLPFDVSNAVLAVQILERTDREDDEAMQVLLTAVESSYVDEHISLIIDAGLEPDVVDLAPLALMNEVAEEGLVNGRAVAVVEMGRTMTHLSVYAKDSLFFSRAVPMPASSPGSDDRTDSKGDAPGNGSPPAWLSHVLRETRFSLTYYNNETGKHGIEAVYLAGGHALEEGIADAFRETLGIPTETLNPLEHVASEPLQIEELSRQGARFALAMGLARRR